LGDRGRAGREGAANRAPATCDEDVAGGRALEAERRWPGAGASCARAARERSIARAAEERATHVVEHPATHAAEQRAARPSSAGSGGIGGGADLGGRNGFARSASSQADASRGDADEEVARGRPSAVLSRRTCPERRGTRAERGRRRRRAAARNADRIAP